MAERWSDGSPRSFVGREKEAAYLRAELQRGRSVVMAGPYGSGRTALARHVAERMARDWLFVFSGFERGPAEVWRSLFAALFPKAQARLRGASKPAQWLRYRVANLELEDPRRHVVVLDDIARVTDPRLEAVRRLRERFQVVAILEGFVPQPDRAALCAALFARAPVQLGRLSTAATAAFLGESSDRHAFGWGAGEIRGLARAVAGSPLGMRELVAAELRRREALRKGDRSPR
jgi:AAA ATPase domain